MEGTHPTGQVPFWNKLSTGMAAVLVILKFKYAASCLRMCSNLHFCHNNGASQSSGTTRAELRKRSGLGLSLG